MGTIDILILCFIMLLLGVMLGVFSIMLVAFTADREEKKPAPAQDQKQKEEPCESCLRWSECNGADERCPYR